MVCLPNSNDLFVRRFRRGIVISAILLSLFSMDHNPARAASTLIPLGRRNEDPPKIRVNKGFSVAIRKLLAEAKIEEESGNIDRAIVLADRAKKLSESSSTIVKPSPEVSPEATSRYANDLRLKKREQSVKRMGGTNVPRGQLRNTEPAEKPTQSVVSKPEAPTPKSVAAIKPPKNRSDSRSTASTPTPPPLVASPNPERKRSENADRSSDLIMARSTKEAPVVASRKPSAPAALPDLDDDFDTNNKIKSKDVRTDAPKLVAAVPPELSESIDEWSTPSNQLPEVTPLPPLTPKAEVQVSNAKTSAKRFKLRQRFTANEPLESRMSIDSDQKTAGFDGQPKITPMVTSSFVRKELDEPGWIVTIASVDESELKATTDESTTPDSSPRTTVGEVERPWDEDVGEEFPAERVLELKRRLDSAAALNPGEITPLFTETQINAADHEATTDDSANRHLERFPKHRHLFREIPSVVPEPLKSTIPIVRKSVVGRTSMIQWRSANDDSAAPSKKSPVEPKSVRLADDLRQLQNLPPEPAIERAPELAGRSLFSLPKVELGHVTDMAEQPARTDQSPSTSVDVLTTTTPLQGSIWDSAIAPAEDGFSGSVIGSAKSVEKGPAAFDNAPLPPLDLSVEQVSFDHSDDRIHHRHGSHSHNESATSANTKEASGKTGSQSSIQKGLTEAPTSSHDTTAKVGLVERLALKMGISNSAASAILGACGMMTLIAGLWAMRASIRSRKM